MLISLGSNKSKDCRGGTMSTHPDKGSSSARLEKLLQVQGKSKYLRDWFDK